MVTANRSVTLRTIVWQLPDMVILDTQLAGEDGVALCASLKQDARMRHIPIILTTDRCDADEHLHAVEAGADDYLPQSDIHLVKARIGTLVEARRWIEALVRLEQTIMMIEQV